MTAGSTSCINKVEVLKMRSPLPFAFLLALTITAGAAQQAGNHGAPRFDPPTVTTVTEAIYPPQSVAWGTVVLEVSLDNGGKITDVRVVRGIPSLTESAEQAVQGWKFQPARLNGKPVPSKVPVAFSFVPPNVGPRV
jgi:TonB family protein